jgi:ribonuclease HI
MAENLEDFNKFRADLNEEILGCGHLGMKRFFALDHQAYEPGALTTKTKEMLGLTASMVLRCDDCITYHLVRCAEEGWTRAEVIDALDVSLIVGGIDCDSTRAAGVCSDARNSASEARMKNVEFIR